MKTILVGIDFTKSSDNATLYAIAIAQKTQSKILLFHAIQTPLWHSNSGLFFISAQAILKDETKRMYALKDKLSKQYPLIPFDVFITKNNLIAEVKALSKTHKIQLAVLGLETKHKISKYIYGTSSVELTGKLNCPIVIVPESYKTHRIEKALISIDNKESISSSVSKRIHEAIDYLAVAPEFIHIRTEDELNLVSTINKQFNIKTIASKDFATGVKNYAKKTKADLIVLISHKHNPIYNFFIESYSKIIIFESSVPVISIHH